MCSISVSRMLAQVMRQRASLLFCISGSCLLFLGYWWQQIPAYLLGVLLWCLWYFTSGERFKLISLLPLALCFVLAPALSDDYHRYLWEGHVANRGFSPYQHAPQSLYEQMEHPSEGLINNDQLTAVYPPLAQYLFRIANLLSPYVWSWKLLILGIMLLCFWQVPQARSFWFSPLLLVEGFWNAHLDVLGVGLGFLFIQALQGEMAKKAGLFLGMLTAIKLLPAIFFPIGFLYFRGKQRWLFTLCFSGTLLLCYAPFLNQLPQLFSSFVTFSKQWSFNNPIFFIGHQWITGNTLRLVMSLSLLLSLAVVYLGKQDLNWKLSACWIALITFSPTVYPWYFLWLIPLIDKGKQKYLELAFAGSCFSYLVLVRYQTEGVWQESLWWMIPEWGLLLFCFWHILDGPKIREKLVSQSKKKST